MPKNRKAYRLSDDAVRQLAEIQRSLHGLAETRIVENAIERYHREVTDRATDRDTSTRTTDVELSLTGE